MLPKPVIEDAKEWCVVSGNKEVRASQGEDTRMLQAPTDCQCLYTWET